MIKIKKISTLIVMAMLAMLIAVVSCKKDPTTDSPVVGNLQNVTLKGMVTNEKGEPLNGVMVSTGNLKVISNSKGEFNFSQAEVVNNRVVIKFEKSGYFTLTRSGIKAKEMFIEAAMCPEESDISIKTTFDASSEKTLKIGDMEVKLPASCVKRADGSDYTGTVTAKMIYLDPNNENFVAMMPGGDLAGTRTDNSEAVLISYGMTNVNLTDDKGQPLQLKNDSKSLAQLTFPIPAGMENNPPETIPLWSFDEQKGIWIEEGVATREGNVYVGTVSHFSWVNLDDPKRIVTLKGWVVCLDDVPVSWVRVKINNPDVGNTAAYTNSEGAWTAIVPENTSFTVTVEVSGSSDTQNVPPQQAQTTYTVITLRVECPEEEEEGEPEHGSDTDKGAVRYYVPGEGGEEDNVLVVTFDTFNGKQRTRMDFYGESHIIYLRDNYNNECFAYEDFWVPFPCGLAPEFIIRYTADNLISDGYVFERFKTIAGKLCAIYAGMTDGDLYKYGIWNGIIMYLERNGVLTLEATAVKLTVPAKFFSQETIEVDWI